MPLRVKIGVPCPNPDCGGELVERINKKKRRFYGCSRYPDCNFIMNQKPIPRPCPECGKPLISTRKGRVKCIACTYKGKEDELQKEGALS